MTDPRTLLRAHPDYPTALHDLEDPPATLHVRGPLEHPGPRVGIVGARKASERGRALATGLAADLTRAGALVLSGGALGIDGAAHRGALRAGGPTWVVLPSPVTAPTPTSHRRLFDDVLAAGGTWLSETTEVDGKHRYYRRNRVVAALCDVLVVVEARLSSGTRHTVEAARALGRPVGAFPWAVGEPFGEGCLTWLREGAALVTGADDVRRMLEDVGRPLGEARAAEAADPLLEALGEAGAVPEALAATLALTVPQVLSRLTVLELGGSVARGPGGRYLRRRV